MEQGIPQPPTGKLRFEEWEELRLKRLEAFDRDVPRSQRLTVLAGLACATGIEIAGRTATGFLLPDMQGNAGATLDELSWVMIAYNTGYICSLGVSAGIVRSFGIRKLWLTCLFLYGVGTLLTFFSHELAPLLIARAIAGLGGGIFIVRSVLFLRELFPKKEVPMAITMFNVILFSIKGLWPVVMGALSDAGSWNDAFLTEIPFVALSFFIVWKFLPARAPSVSRLPPADYLGVGLLLSGLISCQVALNRGEREMWFQASWISFLLIFSAICFAFFIWWDSREGNENPILHIRNILSQHTYTAAFGLVLLCGAFMGAGLYVIPQYLRIIQSYNAQQTSVFYLVDTIGLLTGVSVAVWIGVPRFGGAKTAALGSLLFGACMAAFVFSWTDQTPGSYIGWLLLLHGTGVGLLLAGTSLLSTGSLDRRFQNEAATSYFFLRQLGASLGVTAAAVLIDQRMTVHSSRILDAANRLNPAVQTTLRDFAAVIAARGDGTSVPNPGNYEIFRGLVVTQARLLAFIDICFCLAVGAAFFLIVLAVARWRQLHVVSDPRLSMIVGR